MDLLYTPFFVSLHYDIFGESTDILEEQEIT